MVHRVVAGAWSVQPRGEKTPKARPDFLLSQIAAPDGATDCGTLPRSLEKTHRKPSSGTICPFDVEVLFQNLSFRQQFFGLE
jgi:hypothetical protein